MANKITLAMPFRPALARLRRSSRCAVFGLAAIAIAGCDVPMVCHNGQLYADDGRDGIYTKRNVECIEPKGE